MRQQWRSAGLHSSKFLDSSQKTTERVEMETALTVCASKTPGCKPQLIIC